MNQILATEKVYITPELKRKKKLYKVEFFLSILFICLLFSFYIYAEYDKTKSEEASKTILANFNKLEEQDKQQEEDVKVKDNVIVVALNEDDLIQQEKKQQEIQIQQLLEEEKRKAAERKESLKQWEIAPGGQEYCTLGSIRIPKINVNYPIFDAKQKDLETIEALIKISPCKFHGVDPNEEGNLSIVGHNYWDWRFFSKVPTLEKGDIIEITDLEKKTLTYEVYDKYNVDPEDTSCTNPETNGTKEITLITCTNDGSKRVIVKAVEIK